MDFEVKIGRLIITGPQLDEAKAQRLRELIREEMQEKMASLKRPKQDAGADVVRIEVPDFPANAVEWERRVARATADAAFERLGGK